MTPYKGIHLFIWQVSNATPYKPNTQEARNHIINTCVKVGITGVIIKVADGLYKYFRNMTRQPNGTYHDDIIPPTINHDQPGDECDLDYVPNTARKTAVNIAMTNSFGFGGTNASLILKKYDD